MLFYKKLKTGERAAVGMLQKEIDKKYLVKSLAKSLRVLDTVIVQDRLTLKDICTATGFDKASVFKILYTMERWGYVAKSEDARYSIGEKIMHYSNNRSSRKNIVEVAAPEIRALSRAIGETVVLAILNSTGRSINIFVEVGRTPNAVPSKIGFELDAYSISSGKVLLAYSPTQLVQHILQDASFHAYTSSTIADPTQLYRVLEDVRAKGYCADSNERYDGRSSIAVPVFDAQYQCVAALALVCTTDTFERKKDEFLEKIIPAAAVISREMGCPVPGENRAAQR